MKKAAVFRLYPTADQKHYLAGLFGAVRFCYNKGLELKKHYYNLDSSILYSEVYLMNGTRHLA